MFCTVRVRGKGKGRGKGRVVTISAYSATWLRWAIMLHGSAAWRMLRS